MSLARVRERESNFWQDHHPPPWAACQCRGGRREDLLWDQVGRMSQIYPKLSMYQPRVLWRFSMLYFESKLVFKLASKGRVELWRGIRQVGIRF